MTTSKYILLVKEEEGWVAVDCERSIASQASTREAALEQLDEEVASYEGEVHEPSAVKFRELVSLDDEQATRVRERIAEL